MNIQNTYCSFDEAFGGPVLYPTKEKDTTEREKEPREKDKDRKKKQRNTGGLIYTRENFSVPAPLPGVPDPDRPYERPSPRNDVLTGPSGTKPSTLESGMALSDMFPLPGNTASNESWEKVFMLEPDWTKTTPVTRPDGSVSVNGQSTLWRNIPAPTSTELILAPAKEDAIQSDSVLAQIPSELNQRLDSLTRQLESLSMPTPLQSTAELFLFIAIGLLTLLAIDTLLRYTVQRAKTMRGGGGFRAPRRFHSVRYYNSPEW
jgi:hypothetical protein